jgi:hypothetical protein
MTPSAKNKTAPSLWEKRIKIERTWAMPNKWTFTIKPIKELLLAEVTGGYWADPFAGENGGKYATNTNDIALGGTDALTYLKNLATSTFDGVLYDPPYSITQARMYGKKEFSSMKYWKECKDQIARILKPSGKVICFGWNSMGLGKNRGFTMNRILLVSHGGSKNDTIVTVESKGILVISTRQENKDCDELLKTELSHSRLVMLHDLKERIENHLTSEQWEKQMQDEAENNGYDSATQDMLKFLASLDPNEP